jgi:hypothetical protein
MNKPQKYKVGDKVWVRHNKMPKQITITMVEEADELTGLRYRDGGLYFYLHEDCFDTEELERRRLSKPKENFREKEDNNEV